MTWTSVGSIEKTGRRPPVSRLARRPDAHGEYSAPGPAAPSYSTRCYTTAVTRSYALARHVVRTATSHNPVVDAPECHLRVATTDLTTAIYAGRTNRPIEPPYLSAGTKMTCSRAPF